MPTGDPSGVPTGVPLGVPPGGFPLIDVHVCISLHFRLVVATSHQVPLYQLRQRVNIELVDDFIYCRQKLFTSSRERQIYGSRALIDTLRYKEISSNFYYP